MCPDSISSENPSSYSKAVHYLFHQKKKQKYAWESQDDISRSVFIPESVHDDKRNVDGNASGERKTNKV